MQQEIYQKRSSTSQGAAKDRYASSRWHDARVMGLGAIRT
jgi:hypothetical protein